MGGVVNILVRQVKGDDLAVAGVNANVQLAPSAALCRAMFFKQPFAGPAQFQSRTVDDQVKFARSNPREVANRQSTRSPAQRRMIGNRQVDLQHFHDPINGSWLVCIWRESPHYQE